MNDLGRTYACHAADLDNAALDAIRSGWWVNGPRSQAFCQAFARFLGVAHCIGVGNGTDALEIVLRAILADWGVSSSPPEIVTVANAGGYASTACHLVGCIPVFADIEPDSQLISIPSAISVLTANTAAVLVTHLYGGLVNVPALRQAMNDVGFAHVPVLEDCAQAHGLEGCGGKAGSFGLAATYSFYPTKNLGALGDGGAIVTNDDGFADKVRGLRQYGWGERYHIRTPGGRNSRLDEIQAAMLLTLLPHLSAANARRRDILCAFERAVVPAIRVVRSPYGTVAHLAIMLTEDRVRLCAHLAAGGIATDIHYPVLDCDQEGWRDLAYKVAPGGLDVSRWSVKRIVSIPCFPTMTLEEVDAVCHALASYETA